ncbi:histidine phosphatase family protein [Shewanella sp. 10N.261.52.F9]|uniref:SixA phosphatase family protein n=1 Tax=Shewanella sp. 10N.261.52.F9 TaxID=3229684 RepID=UPI003552587C
MRSVRPSITKIRLLLVLGTSLMTMVSISSQAESNKKTAERIDNQLMRTVVLVRHAEKHQDGTRDPQLSAAGEQRAQALVNALTEIDLSQLIASDYQRTQLTIAPLATQLGIPITIATTKAGIDAHISEIVTLVNKHNGSSLIAGHSNTVPMLVTALGGPSIATIVEDEYGALYLLSITQDGKVDLKISHYGKPSAQKKGDL